MAAGRRAGAQGEDHFREHTAREGLTRDGEGDGRGRMGVDDRFHAVLPARRALIRGYRALGPTYPAVIKANPLPEADLLVTSSFAVAPASTSKVLRKKQMPIGALAG